MRKRANPRAGQGLLHSTVGKHTRNPGYKPGEHWVTCQRCGLDYYSKDIQREWTGAIVCKSCWEPRHPQDFVRTRAERIQAPGATSGTGSLLNQTAAAGSTEAPGGTFNIGSVTTGTIPNQTYEIGDTITTITGNVFTSTLLTVDSYSIDWLPDALSMSTSTGDITGMLNFDDVYTAAPSTVTVKYTNDQTFDATFTWTVTDPRVVPPGTPSYWYDFTDRSQLYTDAGGTVVATAAEDTLIYIGNKASTEHDLDAITGVGGEWETAGGANSMPYVQMDGESSFYDSVSDGEWTDGARTLLCVHRPDYNTFGYMVDTTTTRILGIASVNASDNFPTAYGHGATWRISAIMDDESSVGLDNAMITGSVGDEQGFHKNSLPHTVGSEAVSDPIAVEDMGFIVGNGGDSPTPYTGKMYEVLVWIDGQQPTETEIRDYVLAKYALTWSDATS